MKKLIVLTLTLCLMLAGCSSTGNNNSSSQSGEENQTTASAAFTDEMKIEKVKTKLQKFTNNFKLAWRRLQRTQNSRF